MNTPITKQLLRTVTKRTRVYSTTPQSPHPYPYLNSTSSSSTSSPHVGPFPLPHTSSKLDRDYLISQQAKTWSRMNKPEKAQELAKQTSSFFVVTLGAGLCGLVVWAVASELFSENSPTRIFEDITQRLKEDQILNEMLIGPLSFHGSSTSSDRLRRQRRIQHSITRDPQSGQETLFIRFIVEGKDPNAAKEEQEESWLDWSKKWIGPLVWQDSKHPENYNPTLSKHLEQEQERLRKEKEQQERSSLTSSWSNYLSSTLSSAFGGLLPKSSSTTINNSSNEGGSGLFKRLRKPKLGEFSTGEVVAELIKNPQTNQFVYKQLFVAVPDTATPSYYRHDIPTQVVVPPPEGEQQQRGGLNRLRIWQRSRTVVQ
ncbi:hypothetical protein JCM3765_004335 [Sporobolomyces pararoseus]